MLFSRCSKLLGLAALLSAQDSAPEEGALTELEVAGAAAVLGLEFDADELELMTPGVSERQARLRQHPRLRPRQQRRARLRLLGLPGAPGRVGSGTARRLDAVPRVQPMALRPDDLEQLCFADIPTLAALIQTRQVSCLELTDMYLARLARLDAELRVRGHAAARAGARQGRGARSRARARGDPRTAARHPLRRQGPPGRARRADHLGRRSVRGAGLRRGRRGRGAPRGGRRGADRQALARRARLGRRLVRRAHQQPLGSPAGLERLLGRAGGRDRRGRGGVLDRLGDLRLDRVALGRLRLLLAAADLRHGQPPGSDGAGVDDGQARADLPLDDRRGTRDGGHRRPRRARRPVPRPALPRSRPGRSRRPARGLPRRFVHDRGGASVPRVAARAGRRAGGGAPAGAAGR